MPATPAGTNQAERANVVARRGKTSQFDDLIALVALMPWWVGIGVAVVGYLVLSGVATAPLPVATNGTRSSGLVLGAMVRGLATVGQYLIPLVGVVGAVVSIWRRRQRNALVEEVAQNQSGSVLDGMSWREFEMLVGEGFRLQGYRVLETGGGGADGGVDLVLSRPSENGSEKFLVQCKQWRALRVGVDVVRELYGVMAARGAAGGFVVTSGRFTDEAMRFAQGRNLQLLDGQELRGLIQRARGAKRSHTANATAATTAVSVPAAKASGAPTPFTPTCPVCSGTMVRRTAKRGANVGNEFWGCTGYPACRGTRSMPSP